MCSRLRQKVWMDAHTFNAWLRYVREEFKRRGRIMFMIMDNAGAHSILAAEQERTVVRNVTESIIQESEYVQTYLFFTS